MANDKKKKFEVMFMVIGHPGHDYRNKSWLWSHIIHFESVFMSKVDNLIKKSKNKSKNL